MKYFLIAIFTIFTFTSFGQSLTGSIPGGIYSGTYYVDDDIQLDPNESMIIEQGTQFLFNGRFKFDIFGDVEANGTFDEPIYFTTSADATDWHGIRIDNSGGHVTGSQRFEYCFFTNTRKSGSACSNLDSISNIWGSAMYIRQWRDASFYNCSFINGKSFRAGGSMAVIEESFVFMEDCSFKQNQVIDTHGGALFFRYASNAELNRVTFEKNIAYDRGGGIFIGAKSLYSSSVFSGCEIELNKCKFICNSAARGGAVYNENGTMNFSSCEFLVNDAKIHGTGSNSIGGHGGALVVDNLATCNVNDCTFEENTAELDGGGIYVTLSSHCIIKGGYYNSNSAGVNGGGFYVHGTSATNGIYSNLRIYNAKIDACESVENGGALYVEGAYAESGIVESQVTYCKSGKGGAVALVDDAYTSLWHTTFDHNFATNKGGALYLNDSKYYSGILNCLFTNNKSNLYGGALHIEYSTAPTLMMYMESNTIAENTAFLGGGLSMVNPPLNLTYYRIANTIIYDNHADASLPYLANFSNVPANLFSHCQVAYVNNQNAIIGTFNSTNVTSAPAFMSSTDFRVHSYSAGVNAGRNSTPIHIPLDLNNTPRTQGPQGLVITDIGAYEDNPQNPIRKQNPVLSELEDDLKIYPNPAADKLYFEVVLTGTSNLRYEVINTIGQVCKSNDYGTFEEGFVTESVDVSDLPEGYYIIKLEASNKVMMKKIVIKH